MDKIYHHRFAATIEALCETMREVEKFLQAESVPESVSFVITLSLEEIVSNTIKYGCKNSRQYLIEIRVAVRPGEVALEIVDDAQAFNPLSVSEPDTTLSPEERPIGGLGIHLVKTLADQCSYERIGNKNRMYITKKTG